MLGTGTAGASRWWLLLVVPGSMAGVALAWALASPDGPEASSIVRAPAVGVGAVVLGMAVLGWMLRAERRPSVAADELWRRLAGLAGAWTLLEAVLLGLTAAEAEGGAVAGLSVAAFVEFLGSSTGRVGVAVVVCTLAIVVLAAVAFRRGIGWPTAPVPVLAALALIARPITGHMSQQPFGSVLDAVHALAAAVWFGMLVALAATLRSRGAWAVWLPRYSTIAWRSVGVLAVTGVVDAAVRLGGIAALFETGYGRVVLAKAAVLVVLLGLGWWWRRTWVGAAAGHRMTADASLRRAVGEVTVMAVAFGLAAALATTA